MSCCGADMVLLSENTTEATLEKHVPTVTKTDNGIVVNVGSADHPMADDHFVEWIEIHVGGVSNTVFLQPGDKSQACFPANDVICQLELTATYTDFGRLNNVFYIFNRN